MKHIRQIIFDADDTLWENNIYYLKAANAFFDLLESENIHRNSAEAEFDKLELQVVNEFGYGSTNFVLILEELFKRFNLKGQENRQKLKAIIAEFNTHKINKPCLFENVTEIIKRMRREYDLYILTKGDFEEQESKIIKSGLSPFINQYFILAEKDDLAYAQLLKKHNWHSDETCMIGNSPKSDINPALRNNMFAVHIPYRDTWKIDIEPIVNADGKYRQINCFKELEQIFL